MSAVCQRCGVEHGVRGGFCGPCRPAGAPRTGPASRIQQRRIALGWSQKAFLAALNDAGFNGDASRVSRIEAGQVDLRFSDVLLFCRVLGCTPNDLAGIVSDAERDAKACAAEEIRRTIEQLETLRERIAA